MTEFEDIIADSLRHFARYIVSTSWWGKEREAISLYAFASLVPRCRPGAILYDLAQIAIESRIPKSPNLGTKREVCKDLVIWPKPGLNCWDRNHKSTVYPLAVFEWKVNQRAQSSRDIEWLSDYSNANPSILGYAVRLDLTAGLRLLCARICKGEVNGTWLVLDRSIADNNNGT